ncbi:MAG: hypothetical protein EBV03_12300 [Proteobacteria bacterium]|nr:hypothetical protein [Pseudomonadota bacterium]
MALNDALQGVLKRNSFYRDAYRFLLRLTLVQGVTIFILAGMVIALLILQQPNISYFATSLDGRIITMQPRAIQVE